MSGRFAADWPNQRFANPNFGLRKGGLSNPHFGLRKGGLSNPNFSSPKPPFSAREWGFGSAKPYVDLPFCRACVVLLGFAQNVLMFGAERA